jgi:hypothetical protein
MLLFALGLNKKDAKNGRIMFNNLMGKGFVAVIAFKNEELDLEVYINVKDLSYNEVYNNETLYELVERLGGDIIEAYQSGEEL